MRRLICGCIVMLMAFSVFSQTIDLQGKVLNSSGSPISEAIVTLVGKNIADTTGADGMYQIQKDDPTATTVFEIPQTEMITLQRGIVNLNIPEAASMSVEVFNISGTILDNVSYTHASAGIYHFNILKNSKAPQMLLVRAAIGNSVSTFRYLPLQQKLQLISKKQHAVSSANQALSKQLADVDSLKITADGYQSVVIAIASFEEENDVTLVEAVDMDPFSFFVTSWETIQELAGEDGFGGDLRFGETGPGAGLRGADKICETIAEMSMPGSAAKQWRAFLSVAEDENGNQVDARDRVGQGPWYDRKGRLLAPTLDDLINERPQNGDSEIQNDLPNEWGIPNHRPDPNAGDVDNHHMITGSDGEGRLISGGKSNTCQDWTSVSGSDKATCGFAWPRGGMRKTTFGGGGGGGGMGGSHWITGFTSSGCEAGAHLIDDGPGFGSGNIIGSGGGYGGWYCFALNP